MLKYKFLLVDNETIQGKVLLKALSEHATVASSRLETLNQHEICDLYIYLILEKREDFAKLHTTATPYLMLLSQLNHQSHHPSLYLPTSLQTIWHKIESLLEVRPETISLGPYQLDTHQKLLHLYQETCSLTEIEMAILIALSQAKENYLPKHDLLQTIWGYNPDISTHTLETHIYRLRQKIPMAKENIPLIITDKQGYKLNFE